MCVCVYVCVWDHKPAFPCCSLLLNWNAISSQSTKYMWMVPLKISDCLLIFYTNVQPLWQILLLEEESEWQTWWSSCQLERNIGTDLWHLSRFPQAAHSGRNDLPESIKQMGIPLCHSSGEQQQVGLYLCDQTKKPKKKRERENKNRKKIIN